MNRPLKFGARSRLVQPAPLIGAAAPRHWPTTAGSWALSGPGRLNRNGAGYDRSFIQDWEANPPKGYPTISNNIEPTKAAIDRYAQSSTMAASWRSLRCSSSRDDASRRRLCAGDLPPRETFARGRAIPNYFDNYLERAVKRFQASNGLAPTGIVDDARSRPSMFRPARACASCG